MSFHKMNLNKSGAGMTARTACGRNILRTPLSMKWDDFKMLPVDQRCEKCDVSRQAEVNRRMTLTFPVHQDVLMGEPYWTYVDDGSPVPPNETPEAKAMAAEFEWSVRENDYPLDDYGYAYCSCCGERVDCHSFCRHPNSETKDYCEVCARIADTNSCHEPD